MIVNQKSVQGLYDISFEPAEDHRGYLAKPFDEKPFVEAGIDVHWKQIILQYTKSKNTVKGFHIQRCPFTEAKLIIPVVGEFIWVSVDSRTESPTYGKLSETRMGPDSNSALFASRGFAHGFLNFEDDTQILIAADNDYSESHGDGFAWDDPDICYKWPVLSDCPVVMKDEHRNYGSFAKFMERNCV